MSVSLAAAPDELADLLRRLTREGGDANFLVCNAGDAYAQFSAARGDDEVYCETTANRFLPPERRLTEDKIWRLQQFGYEHPRDGSNFHRNAPLESSRALDQLALETVAILTEIYGCDPDTSVRFRLELQDLHRPENEALLEALARLEAGGDAVAWRQVVAALIDAEFLLPVEDPGADDVAEPLYVVDPAGERALPLFTDMDAVERMGVDGIAVTIVKGRQILPWALRTEVPAIVIDPGSPRAGHIDREGLRALVEAIAAAT